MFRRVCSALAVVFAAGLVAAAPAAADVTYPILPKQYFAGVVNGSTGKAVIKVGCFGPSAAGHPLPGQYVSVIPRPDSKDTDVGYTGSAGTAVIVGFGNTVTGQPLRISTYYTSVEIPATLSLPCGGTGQVTFAPVPTSSDARTAVVVVAYESTGV
jgi:hypothetical protein